MSLANVVLQKSIEFAEEISLDRVDRDDKPMVRDILMKLVSYQTPMPKLDIHIQDYADHYTITIKGWSEEFDMVHFAETFGGPKRAETFESIKRIMLRPVGESGGEPVMRIKVERNGAVYSNNRR